MRSSYFNIIFLIGFFSLGAGCGVQSVPDSHLPAPIWEEQTIASIPSASRQTPYDEIYLPAHRRWTACQWLTDLGKPVNADFDFRLLGGSDVTLNSKTNLPDFLGNVDPGGSPLYSYALLGQTIPNKSEFLALVDKEFSSMQEVPFKLRLGALLMKKGLLNPLKQRNSIFQKKINEAFPGIFDSTSTLNRIQNSIPWMLLKNGNPDLELALALQDKNNSKISDQQITKLTQVMRTYAESVRVFGLPSWQSFEVEFRTGLSLALRGLRTTDPMERACSTALLHRMLSQMFMVIGYDRLPFEPREDGKGFHLPPFKDLLDSPAGNHFLVCPSAGSFVLKGHRKILDREALSTPYSQSGILYDLMPTPQVLPLCQKAMAIPYTGSSHQEFNGGSELDLAQATDWLSFINAMGHFFIAFNPGAPWWMDPTNTLGFPMSPFESLEQIKSSNAILPTDANALALGLINISVPSFQKKHLIFLTSNMKITETTTEASKIRISEEPKDLLGNHSPIRTKIRAATLLAEISFKLAESLKRLDLWQQNASTAVREDMLRTTDSKKRLMIFRDYRNFIDSLYASDATLKMLITSDKDSFRDQLETLKLAASLLVMQFASHDNAKCYSELIFDPQTGRETPFGACNEEDLTLWKFTIGLIAQEYRSPIFQQILDNAI